MAKRKKFSKKASKKSKKQDYPGFGFWESSTGKSLGSCVITERVLEAFAQAEEGGALVLRETPAEILEEYENVPAFSVTIFPPKDEEEDDESL